MSDSRTCCVSGCDSNRKHSGFAFTKDSILGSKWIEALQLQCTHEEARQRKYRVCTKHFRLMVDYYPINRGKANRLIAGAVPSLHLPSTEAGKTKNHQELGQRVHAIDKNLLEVKHSKCNDACTIGYTSVDYFANDIAENILSDEDNYAFNKMMHIYTKTSATSEGYTLLGDSNSALSSSQLVITDVEIINFLNENSLLNSTNDKTYVVITRKMLKSGRKKPYSSRRNVN